MSLPTVRVTIRGLFQQDDPFYGIIRFRLSRTAASQSKHLVTPYEWQDVEFSAGGVAVAELIPNSVIGAGTFYEYQIIKRTYGVYISERYCEEHCVLKGVVVIPDHDCEFVDIAPLPGDGKGTAESYASEAKQAALSVEATASIITETTARAETLEAGAEATATYSYDEKVLTLGIPRGERGEKGERGEPGEPGASVVQEAYINDDGRLVLVVV